MVQVIHRAYAGTPGVDVVRNEAVLAEVPCTMVRHTEDVSFRNQGCGISDTILTVSGICSDIKTTKYMYTYYTLCVCFDASL